MTAQLPIQKERLEKIASWRETYGAGRNVMLPAEEAEALARFALAAHEQEPVAYMCDGEDGREYNGHNEFSCGVPGIPLYTHPAPVPAVPDYYVVVTTANVWQTFCKTRAEADFIVSKPFHKGYYVLEVYTRRAAMLNGGKS